MNIKIFSLSCILLLCLSLFSQAVSLPAIYGDHMVMQQNSKIKIWGWGKPQEKISITTSWSTDTLKTEVDNQANWSLMMETPEAGGPYSFTVQGYNTLQIEDVLIGEVWLLSGQSNMEWSPRGGLKGGEKEVKEASNPELRLFIVEHRTSSCPAYDVDGHWMVCSPESVMDFSAVGFFFGRQLQEQLDQPVGLICSAWGGTPVEVWTPKDEIVQNENLREGAAKLEPVPWGPVEPGRAYNAMIAPLMPFNIAGALWYQGEANTANPDTYEAMLKTMIRSWRVGFGIEFPFYLAQIAPYNGYGGDTGVKIRDAQRRVLSEPKTGMVVVADVGDTVDIHPRNKIDVGHRFANLALNQAYGMSNLAYSSPLFSGFKVEKGKAIVAFEHSEGLYAKDDLTQFEIAGNDGEWYPAKAKVKNETVVLSNPKVEAPVNIRYAWGNACVPKLFNGADLPASSFTTVDWNK
ncbi:sialate O-acetylesterase [Mangrovibacterium lignilyticum]|uniref:sialate O-acetylesterase n=1 Tax=Mangrovibacterium lignilyticum TaxID=2668052 RepID=UPI0013D2426F|nr:sialate O-acetylesterase [Mangrovibacterium lignilyticum]